MRPTATNILREPLFVAGGRGAEEPPDEIWALVASGAGSEKWRAGDSTPSQLTTADTGAKSSLSSNGGVSSGSWSATPLSDGNDSPAVSADFQMEMQACRAAHRELSRNEFQ